MGKITTEIFIERARKAHGDKYYYSETVYSSAKKPLKIICPVHGAFLQLPSNHTSGKGCNQCAKIQRGVSRRLPSEEFIDRARRVHGSRYSYDHCIYVKHAQKVKINCSTHGDFEMLPANHLKGSGCPECSKIEKRNTPYAQDEFTQKAHSVHSKKYDYSASIYVSSKSRIKIICKIHGVFQQVAGAHLQGRGCRKCAKKKTSDSQRSNTLEFIRKSRKIHGDIYGYERSEYINNSTSIKITCPTHGEFEQLPANHLKGKGCRKCKQVGPAKRTQSEFLERAIDVHGEKYDYSDVHYQSCREKISIKCPEHGVFFQVPTDHLSGCGCPLCYRGFDDPCAVYVKTASTGEVKIGIARDPLSRCKRLNQSSPFQVSVHSFQVAENWAKARAVESEIHRKIKNLNCGYTGFDGATEWFNIDPKEAIKMVKQVVKDMDVAA